MTSFGRWIMGYLGIGEHEYEDEEEEPIYDEAPPGSYHARAIPSSPPRRSVVDSHYQEGAAVRTLTREKEDHVRASEPRTAVLRPVEPQRPVEPSVVAPVQFSDAQKIGDMFKAGTAVVVNLARADRDLTRRMIDFCSGAAYSLDGRMQKLADDVFLLEPKDVQVSADQRRKLAERGFVGA